MRRLLAMAVTLACSLILAGCATAVSITPLAGDGQHLTYRRGEPMVASTKTHTVALQVHSTVIQDGKVAEFGIGVHNRANNALVFSTDNVSASWKGQRLKVYSFEELIAEEQRRQSAERVGLALQAFGAALQGGQQTRPVQGTIVGPSGVTTYSGTATYSDPGAAALAQQAVNEKIQAFNADSKAAVAHLERSILRKHTVAPDTAYAGIVRIEMPSVRDGPERIAVIVTIPPDTHSFAVDLKLLQK